MLEVTRFDDDPETYLSLWYYAETSGKMRWSNRFRLCWKVLRTGRGHPDHLVLGPKQVAELRAALPEAARNGGTSVTVFPYTMTTTGIANP
jgi:hypothetical protein